MEMIIGGGFTTFVESTLVKRGLEYSTLMGPGWWYGVLTHGNLYIEQPGFGKSNLIRNTFVHFWSLNALDTFHQIISNSALSAVFIHISPDAIERILGQEYASTLDKNRYVFGRATQAMNYIAHQMITCTRTAAERRLFMSGRSYDLVAALLNTEHTETSQRSIKGSQLSYRELGKINDAIDILQQQLSAPPTCIELASAVGLSARKLSMGFKATHGRTLSSYIKEERLLLARRMLEEGAPNVSFVSYEMGYHPAHFSVEFKKRFGFSPSSLCNRE